MGNILYSFRRCPYAMRARMALALAEKDYEHREVLLRDKPKHMLEVSPKGSVPVLIVGNQVIDESLDIMRWALPNAALDTEIIAMIDGSFKHHLDRYKYASRYDANAKRGDVNLYHRAEAIDSLKQLEDRLSGESYLHGSVMGPSDMASFPFVRQFAAVEPEWWTENASLPRTRDWLARCLDTEIFRKVMQKHQQWLPEN